ncbi:MAG: LamG domain-containing protein [Planctomycetes bacterium]|nr:LamG domain-containing protein [Planctomycetota bacterium]
MNEFTLGYVTIFSLLATMPQLAAGEPPTAHWTLRGDARDSGRFELHAQNQGVTFARVDSRSATASFDGRGAELRVPPSPALSLGRDDFTLALWIHTSAELADDLGDIVSQFEPMSRTGFHLGLRNNTGVTHSLANARQLQFGIDAGSEPRFRDEGRPGNSVYGHSLVVHAGNLYVGTCEPGVDQACHVYRYRGPGTWTDLGSPDRCNSITAMASFQGRLYAGSGKYRLGGSALPESENTRLGGRVFRLEDNDAWTEIAHFPEMEAVGGMVEYRGKLYVSSLYKPAAFHCCDTNHQWQRMEVPNGKRVEALAVYNGYLWATGYDEAHVYRFDGTDWIDLGRVGEEENTQTYAFATYHGSLLVSTWRTGKVFELSLPTRWIDRGRLGNELEVMGMLVHNGKLYAGTLPSGEIYRLDGPASWTALKQLDTTPDTKYRRVWTMAQFQGRLFASTLPSGKIWSMSAGACITWDQPFPDGWHHLAAQRSGKELRLFVDGRCMAESSFEDLPSYDLSQPSPFRIGAGSGDSLYGSLADVRVYRRALDGAEIEALAQPDRKP